MNQPTYDLEALKVLIGAFGGSGVAFFVAYVIFRGWQKALSDKDKILNSRIDALEAATHECAADRKALHSQMFEMQRSVIIQNTEVMQKVLGKLEVKPHR